MRIHWPLVCLAMLFLLPPISAAYLLRIKDTTFESAAYGSFVTPPQYTSLANSNLLIGDSVDNKWVIAYVTGTGLDHHAEVQLGILHEALGVERSRVSVVHINYENPQPFFPPSFILIINPKKMCIMQYKNLVSFDGLFKDMRRLLKYSHV